VGVDGRALWRGRTQEHRNGRRGECFWLASGRQVARESTGPVVCFLPPGTRCFCETPLHPTVDGSGLWRGACTTGRGGCMLAIAHALVGQVELAAPLIFSGQQWARKAKRSARACGICTTAAALAGRIAAHIVADGAGGGQRGDAGRWQHALPGEITGPADTLYGCRARNPIAALAMALTTLVRLNCPRSHVPR